MKHATAHAYNATCTISAYFTIGVFYADRVSNNHSYIHDDDCVEWVYAKHTYTMMWWRVRRVCVACVLGVLHCGFHRLFALCEFSIYFFYIFIFS